MSQTTTTKGTGESAWSRLRADYRATLKSQDTEETAKAKP